MHGVLHGSSLRSPAKRTFRSNRELYSRLGPRRHAIIGRLVGISERFRKAAAHSVGLRSGDRVLEVGCGDGRNFRYLREAVAEDGHVVGIDFCPEMVVAARELCEHSGWTNVEVIEADAATYRSSREFDVIYFGLSYNTFVNDAQRFKILRNLCAQVSGDGAFAIVDAAIPDTVFWQMLMPVIRPLVFKIFGADARIRPWRELPAYLRSRGIRVEVMVRKMGKFNYACRISLA